MREQAAFAELCFGFCSNGQATLRFNFGGVGASSSGALRRSRARDLADLEAAHAHLRETLSHRCALVVHGSAGALVGGNESTFTKVAFIDPSEKDLEPWLNSARKTDAQIFLSEHHLERQSISKRCAGERVNVIANARPGFERGLPQLRREIVDFISA